MSGSQGGADIGDLCSLITWSAEVFPLKRYRNTSSAKSPTASTPPSPTEYPTVSANTPTIVKVVSNGNAILPSRLADGGPLLLYAVQSHRKIVCQCVEAYDGVAQTTTYASHRFSIPLSYPGWFEVLNEEGKTVAPMTHVSELAEGRVEKILVRAPCKAYIGKKTSSGKSSGASEPNFEKSRVVGKDEVLTVVGRITAIVGWKKKKVQLLHCLDAAGDATYLDYRSSGVFSSVAGPSNISGVHKMDGIVANFRFPLTVKVVAGMIPQTSASGGLPGVFRLIDLQKDTMAFFLPLRKVCDALKSAQSHVTTERKNRTHHHSDVKSSKRGAGGIAASTESLTSATVASASRLVPLSTRTPVSLRHASNGPELTRTRPFQSLLLVCAEKTERYFETIQMLVSTTDDGTSPGPPIVAASGSQTVEKIYETFPPRQRRRSSRKRKDTTDGRAISAPAVQPGRTEEDVLFEEVDDLYDYVRRGGEPPKPRPRSWAPQLSVDMSQYSVSVSGEGDCLAGNMVNGRHKFFKSQPDLRRLGSSAADCDDDDNYGISAAGNGATSRRPHPSKLMRPSHHTRSGSNSAATEKLVGENGVERGRLAALTRERFRRKRVSDHPVSILKHSTSTPSVCTIGTDSPTMMTMSTDFLADVGIGTASRRYYENVSFEPLRKVGHGSRSDDGDSQVVHRRSTDDGDSQVVHRRSTYDGDSLAEHRRSSGGERSSVEATKSSIKRNSSSLKRSRSSSDASYEEIADVSTDELRSHDEVQGQRSDEKLSDSYGEKVDEPKPYHSSQSQHQNNRISDMDGSKTETRSNDESESNVAERDSSVPFQNDTTASHVRSQSDDQLISGVTRRKNRRFPSITVERISTKEKTHTTKQTRISTTVDVSNGTPLDVLNGTPVDVSGGKHEIPVQSEPLITTTNREKSTNYRPDEESASESARTEVTANKSASNNRQSGTLGLAKGSPFEKHRARNRESTHEDIVLVPYDFGRKEKKIVIISADTKRCQPSENQTLTNVTDHKSLQPSSEKVNSTTSNLIDNSLTKRDFFVGELRSKRDIEASGRFQEQVSNQQPTTVTALSTSVQGTPLKQSSPEVPPPTAVLKSSPNTTRLSAGPPVASSVSVDTTAAHPSTQQQSSIKLSGIGGQLLNGRSSRSALLSRLPDWMSQDSTSIDDDDDEVGKISSNAGGRSRRRSASHSTDNSGIGGLTSSKDMSQSTSDLVKMFEHMTTTSPAPPTQTSHFGVSPGSSAKGTSYAARTSTSSSSGSSTRSGCHSPFAIQRNSGHRVGSTTTTPPNSPRLQILQCEGCAFLSPKGSQSGGPYEGFMSVKGKEFSPKRLSAAIQRRIMLFQGINA